MLCKYFVTGSTCVLLLFYKWFYVTYNDIKVLSFIYNE